MVDQSNMRRFEIDESFSLDRLDVIPALLDTDRDNLFVTGLAGAARDIAALTNDGNNIFTMAGVMGASCMVGLGLALALPNRRVIVTTGDGELLMNIGALATISVMAPVNLGILCIDNGHYGETGYQRSHTSLGVDIELIAQGAGIRKTLTVSDISGYADGQQLLNEEPGPSFVLARVKPTEPPSFKRLLDPAACRYRFRRHTLGTN